MIEAFKRLVDWCKEQTTDVEYEVKTLSNGSCATCNDTKEVSYVWIDPPNTTFRRECPDCVPCYQCANPECKGVCSCRKFKGGRLLKSEETK